MQKVFHYRKGYYGKVGDEKVTLRKKTAKSLIDRSMGLMFEKSGEIELEIVLPKKTRLGASIHTLFMEYPIHVKWLDENRKVIHEAIIEPWKINYTPPSGAKYVIEKKAE